MKPSEKTNALVMPGRDAATSAQVNTLLSVAGFMMSVLGHFIRTPEEEPTQENRNMAGEARVAAEATFCKTCEALDSILADSNRWTNEFQLRVEKAFDAVHVKHIATLDAQMAAALKMGAPHARFKPSILRAQDGTWMAVLGNATSPDDVIIGVGPTPEAALAVFDAVFSGTDLTPELVEWLREREQISEKPNEQRNDTIETEPS